MKVLAFTLALTAAAAAQSTAPDISGAWTAQFDGRTFVRLELKTVKSTLSGSISLGHVEVDKQGALSQVGEAPRELTPIFDVTQRGSIVTFAHKDVTDVDRFELRVLDTQRAELRMLLSDADRKELAEEGIAVPRPFALRRVGPK
jgi:hypothetical protein